MAALQRTPTKGNKPGEAPFKLELENKDVINIKWEKDAGSTFTDVKITNQFDDWQTFKVRSTDNAIFRVRPPMGTIEPKTSINIRVIQHALARPPAGKHFVALLHLKCTANEAKKGSWKNLWKTSAKPEGIIRIPVAFVDVPGAPGVIPGAPRAEAVPVIPAAKP